MFMRKCGVLYIYVRVCCWCVSTRHVCAAGASQLVTCLLLVRLNSPVVLTVGLVAISLQSSPCHFAPMTVRSGRCDTRASIRARVRTSVFMVALKRPVRRCFGNLDKMSLSVAWKPAQADEAHASSHTYTRRACGTSLGDFKYHSGALQRGVTLTPALMYHHAFATGKCSMHPRN